MSKARIFSIAFLSFIVLIGFGIFVLRPDTEEASCNRQKAGLEPDTPLELAAILDEDCMRLYAREAPDRLPEAFLDFSYPTLLLETENRQDVLNLFTMAVASGERHFFADDPEILNRLRDMRRTAQIEEIIDFAAASQIRSQATHDLYDMERFLEYVDVWENPAGQSLFSEMCQSHDCAISETICPNSLGLSDKLALVEGNSTLAETIALCPRGQDFESDREWFTALRRAGVVDTTCTVTTQLNAVLNDGLSLEEPCFGPMRQIGDYSGNTPGDVVRFIERKVRTGHPEMLNAESLEIVFRFSPDIARYIAANQER